MNMTTRVKIEYTVLETVSAGLALAELPFSQILTQSLAAGTGTDSADLHWEKKEVVLAAGASVTYTLSALTDDLTRTVAFAKIRALLIRVMARTAGAGEHLVVGNAASNPWAAPFGAVGHTTKVYSTLYAFVDKSDAFAVTASSSDQLKITNNGAAAITFAIALVGTSV